MPKTPKSPGQTARSPRSKASKPELQPLGEHLAALLNPALNERRHGEGIGDGFAESPQAAYEAFALENGRVSPYEGADRPGMSGVEATMASLKDLLELGDPNLRDKSPWMLHRPTRPEKSEGGIKFKLVSEYEPRGDQPAAIGELVGGITSGERDQVLLGVTGSGKTFTMAQVIAATQRPALVLAPNKTLAAQLYGEFKNFFPDNAVEYFVSYYDYYQPEA